MFQRYEYEYVLDFLATLRLEGHDVEVLSSGYLTNMIWISVKALQSRIVISIRRFGTLEVSESTVCVFVTSFKSYEHG